MALTALSVPAAAAEPDLSKYGFSDPKGPPPTSVDWFCDVSNGAIPPTQMNAGRWRLVNLNVNEDKHPFVGTLHTSYSRYISAGDGSRPHVNFNFSFELKAGESLPIFDALYRVVEVKPGNYMRLKKVTDEKLARDITSDRSLIVVPVGSGIHFVFYQDGQRFGDTSIVRVSAVVVGDRAGADRARSHTRTRRRAIRLTGATTPSTQRSAGDAVPLVRGCQLTVKKIVPPDEKDHILGWVEFSPDPPKRGGTWDGK